MSKSPFYTKVLDLTAIFLGFLGILIAFKIPGTIAFGPLLVALISALISFWALKKKNTKSVGNYLGLTLASVGIILTILFQSEEAEVAVDTKQEQIIEQSNQEVTKSDELDKALDELEDLDLELE